MNIGTLKNELQKENPNLNATIKKNGVTKFSVFLDKKIDCVRVEGSDRAILTENAAEDIPAASVAETSVPRIPENAGITSKIPIRTSKRRIKKPGN